MSCGQITYIMTLLESALRYLLTTGLPVIWRDESRLAEASKDKNATKAGVSCQQFNLLLLRLLWFDEKSRLMLIRCSTTLTFNQDEGARHHYLHKEGHRCSRAAPETFVVEK